VQARSEHLERCAQTAACHPHRVDTLNVAEVEDGFATVREHGMRALTDDARGGIPVRLFC
jgi:hypothetical protein